MVNDISETIGKISDIRASNNRLWMKLLELALMHAPTQARAVLREINANDGKIGTLLARMTK